MGFLERVVIALYSLVEPSVDLEEAYLDYISEWESSGEKIVPYSSRRVIGEDFNGALRRWQGERSPEVYSRGFVPSTLYFLVDEAGRILAAAHIRHELNDSLYISGGHIGYGVRPAERKKGIASTILAMALPITKSKGIDRVLVTCDKSNLASAKTILKNGGVLENEVFDGIEYIQRYWIEG